MASPPLSEQLFSKIDERVLRFRVMRNFWEETVIQLLHRHEETNYETILSITVGSGDPSRIGPAPHRERGRWF